MRAASRSWRRRHWLLALASLPWWPRLAGATLLAEPDGGPVWSEALARQALSLLADAAANGLDPADYGVDALTRRLPAAFAHPDEPAGPQFAADLGAAMRRYLHELAFGRVDPRALHQRFRVPARRFYPAQALAAALAQGRLDAAVQASLPPLPIYRQLQKVLLDLRAIAGHAAWAQGLPPLPRPPGARAPKLEPGAVWTGVPLLAQRLFLLGDLAPGALVGERLDGELLAALRAFQSRHGLAADGVLGAGTHAALEVPPEARARQVALTMERLRWTPLMQGPRMIVVNIPEYVLRAYEVVDGRIEVRLSMRVIVGKALDHATPLFDERLRSIEFSPYWNVPASIARQETVPRLRRDPGHWARQGFEFVGGDGSVDTALTPAKLDAVLAGRLRIRQRPGPANALGDIKFVFPNSDNIYLHHTPSVGLFARERRDFSHGCIRVEDPVALARFVMDGMPGWDEPRIRTQMAAGTSTHVALRDPVPVLIAYGTVLVKQGRPHFFADVYRHDARLQAALDARPRSNRTVSR